MRILLLCNSFNSMSQRVYIELVRLKHEVSVQLALGSNSMIEAVEKFAPDLIVAPMLTKVIPELIWKNKTCLVVHPGIRGDRGPSALDWAMSNELDEWGVTLLQADQEMDAGDIWSWRTFRLLEQRSKSSIYRDLVVKNAASALVEALERFEQSHFSPTVLDYGAVEINGRLQPLMKQVDRRIDWSKDNTETVLKKIRAADSQPGVLDKSNKGTVYLYDAHKEGVLGGEAGSYIAKRHNALCRATVDGAVWIGHMKLKGPKETCFKLPAATVLPEIAKNVPEVPLSSGVQPALSTFQDIYFEQTGSVGFLYFEFYNGAMSTGQIIRLRKAYAKAKNSGCKVLMLMGGADFWSNGINLNTIEAAPSPEDEAWRNINAMNDFTHDILMTKECITVSAIRGNAGAGGVLFALACDYVLAHENVMLNPHYLGMGLEGSEYWSYSLPKRVGKKCAFKLTNSLLPLDARDALEIKLIDHIVRGERDDFIKGALEYLNSAGIVNKLPGILEEKQSQVSLPEFRELLAKHRACELKAMHANFYDNDLGFREKRHEFVCKLEPAKTPEHLVNRSPQHFARDTSVKKAKASYNEAETIASAI